MLKDKYIELCRNSEAFAQYSEMGSDKFGRIFKFQNTNYRYLESFVTNYQTFKRDVDGVPREEWSTSRHGQEKAKQHVVNMLKSKLFSRNANMFYHTKKGEALEAALGEGFSSEEKWLVLYMLLLDAYFDDDPNYILGQSKRTLDDFVVYKSDFCAIKEMLKNFIEAFPSFEEIEDIFECEYLYFDSFRKPFGDYNFLADYVSASQSEKAELHDYVRGNYENARWSEDIVCKKYKPSGVYNKNMLLDNARLLYMSDCLLQNRPESFSEFVSFLVCEYSNVVGGVRGEKIHEFVFGRCEEVFRLVYLNVFEPDYFERENVSDAVEDNQENDVVEEAQSVSVVENIETLGKVSNILRRKALERAEYNCELDGLHNCASHYFTSKKTGHNYMEMHHLIPRAFSNDFESSVEQIENYVSLCPRCHRMLHQACDRERMASLTFLYNKRHDDLKRKGIEVDLDMIKRYYKTGE